jgi:predicted transcriptional regulator
MQEINLDNLIEVEDSELETGLAINTSQLEEDNSTEVNDTTKTNTDESDLIDVNDDDVAKIESSSTSTEKNLERGEEEEEENLEEDTNPFSAFALLMKDKGLLAEMSDEDFNNINSADDIIKAVNSQLNNTTSEWKNAYKQHLIQNLVNEGLIKQEQVNLPQTNIYSDEEILSDENKARQLLETYYTSKDIPPSQIETIMDALLDIKEEAVKIKPLLEEEKSKRDEEIAQKLKAQEEAQLQQQMSFNEKLQETVNKYEEFIPGRKLSQEDKKDVIQRIPTTLDKINKNLSKYAPILAFLDKYEFLEGKMDSLLQEAETKHVDKFSKIISNKKRGISNTSKRVGGGLSGSGMPQIYK